MRESEKFNAQSFHDHKEWRKEQAEHFVLDYLPPYSPDLNPVERLWKLLRRNCLHNRYFHTLKETVSPDMPCYPGTEPPVFCDSGTLESDGFREKKIECYSHT